MLAGLSMMYCLRMPPCFCADAGTALMTLSNAPAAANVHNVCFIGSSLRRRRVPTGAIAFPFPVLLLEASTCQTAGTGVEIARSASG